MHESGSLMARWSQCPSLPPSPHLQHPKTQLSSTVGTTPDSNECEENGPSWIQKLDLLPYTQKEGLMQRLSLHMYDRFWRLFCFRKSSKRYLTAKWSGCGNLLAQSWWLMSTGRGPWSTLQFQWEKPRGSLSPLKSDPVLMKFRKDRRPTLLGFCAESERSRVEPALCDTRDRRWIIRLLGISKNPRNNAGKMWGWWW